MDAVVSARTHETPAQDEDGKHELASARRLDGLDPDERKAVALALLED